MLTSATFPIGLIPCRSPVYAHRSLRGSCRLWARRSEGRLDCCQFFVALADADPRALRIVLLRFTSMSRGYIRIPLIDPAPGIWNRQSRPEDGLLPITCV